MTAPEALLLFVAGLVAGIVNTLAGAGSLLTLPALVLLGLPGTVANGTNRIGVLVQSLVATWRFRARGLSGLDAAWPVLAPTCVGTLIGAVAVSRIADETFERIYGLLMLALLVPTLRPPRADRPKRPLGARTRNALFFAIGLYGGAFQAGVGIPLGLALVAQGHDLVRAQVIKVTVIAVYTLLAVPIFVWEQQVRWIPALALAGGFAVGGAAGARLTLAGGERIVRAVLGVAVTALAARMLGVF